MAYPIEPNNQRNAAYLWALKTLDANGNGRIERSELQIKTEAAVEETVQPPRDSESYGYGGAAPDYSPQVRRRIEEKEPPKVVFGWDESWGADSVELTPEFAERAAQNPQVEEFILAKLSNLFKQFFGMNLKNVLSAGKNVKEAFEDGEITPEEIEDGPWRARIREVGVIAIDGLDINELVELVGESYEETRNNFVRLLGFNQPYSLVAPGIGGDEKGAWRELCLAAAEERLDLKAWNEIVARHSLQMLEMNDDSFACAIAQDSLGERVGSVYQLSKAINRLSFIVSRMEQRLQRMREIDPNAPQLSYWQIAGRICRWDDDGFYFKYEGEDCEYYRSRWPGILMAVAGSIGTSVFIALSEERRDVPSSPFEALDKKRSKNETSESNSFYPIMAGVSVGMTLYGLVSAAYGWGWYPGSIERKTVAGRQRFLVGVSPDLRQIGLQTSW